MSVSPVAVAELTHRRRGVDRLRGWGLTSPRIVAGLILLGLVAAVALLAPLLAPYDLHVRSGPLNAPPSAAHLLGTDDGGVDMLTLLIWGARVSLLIGIVAALVAMIVGGSVGLAAGYAGGAVDVILMRVTDYFLVLPQIPLMIVVAALWGPSLGHIIIVIGLINWTITARLIRAQVKTLRTRVYVQRARAIGAGHTRIIGTHVLPQLVPLLIANTVLTVAVAVFSETALAFLGLGDPTQTSWGQILANAFRSTAISNGYWWEIIPAGICVSLLVFGCSLIGTAFEERLNPRLRTGHLSVRRYRVRAAADAAEPTGVQS